ncbi:MAG: thioredoxin domain-containing protein [Candidatus Eremiobacteraeota bacterium]|nr:thioredoxin domain-containing protein [Candidatus Eremiobacteraeota bacterium]
MKRWGIFFLLVGTVWAQPMKWETWEPAVFERARREKRYVLLEMEAVWCHWCHVMEETTYKDPEVLDKLGEHYITVKVDQDARPDLSNRYEEYGWPATVIFSPEGQEIVCLTGYVAPRRMAAILQGVVDDPSPIARLAPLPPAGAGLMTEKLRAQAEELHFSHFDYQNGGYSFQHKFLNWNSCEYSLRLALGGDARSAQMARLTLDGQLHLVDPVWGGVYQYSTDNDWVHPHFEKIMEHQANNLRLFTLAARYFGEPRYQQAADRIASYLLNFLRSPEGAFYTSQDADLVKGEHSAEYFALDDKGRRALGMPAIDKHCYARETAWAAEALLLYGDEASARTAMEWVVRERSLAGGGYRHSSDQAGVYLGDTLACGRAFLALYERTGEQRWLELAVAAADFLGKHFVVAGRAGLATAVLSSPLDRLSYVRDENVAAARFFNLLWHYTQREGDRRLRDQALGYLALPEVALEFNTGGGLLADLESRRDPIHFTLGGGVPLAVSGYPCFYRMVTRAEAPPGVLVCDDRGVCSRPFQEAGALAQYLKGLLRSAAR